MPVDEWEPDEEEQRIIAEARANFERREAIPADRRRVIDNPAKYGFPIGLDSSGRPFPLTEHPPGKTAETRDDAPTDEPNGHQDPDGEPGA